MFVFYCLFIWYRGPLPWGKLTPWPGHNWNEFMCTHESINVFTNIELQYNKICRCILFKIHFPSSQYSKVQVNGGHFLKRSFVSSRHFLCYKNTYLNVTDQYFLITVVFLLPSKILWCSLCCWYINIFGWTICKHSTVNCGHKIFGRFKKSKTLQTYCWLSVVHMHASTAFLCKWFTHTWTLMYFLINYGH